MAINLVHVITVAGLLGLAIRAFMPHREKLGIVVLPALAVIAGSLGWAFAMWVGISPDSLWGWVIAMGLAAGVPVAAGILLPPRRDAADAALWESLTR